MRIDVLTLFPEAIEPFVASSIIGRAQAAGLVTIQCINFRDFAQDKHRTVDSRPFGGGAGMLLRCGPVYDALESIEAETSERPTRILLSPQGERLTQSVAEELSREHHLVLLCGHYEGFDDRIREGLRCREISIGDYVLSGGESAAMTLIDAVVRLLPGALGNDNATQEESFSSGTLEYPQYTKPRDFRGMKVPEVLLGGDHGKIRAWRNEQSMHRTVARRPDLLTGTNHKD